MHTRVERPFTAKSISKLIELITESLLQLKYISLREKIDMNKKQDKIDKSLQAIIENSSSNNEKVSIIISLNDDVNTSKVLETLKNISTLDIKVILEKLNIISVCINASYIKLLEEISDIKLIEYDRKVQIK